MISSVGIKYCASVCDVSYCTSPVKLRDMGQEV